MKNTNTRENQIPFSDTGLQDFELTTQYGIKTDRYLARGMNTCMELSLCAT